MKKKRVVILPLDGFVNSNDLLIFLKGILKTSAKDLISHIKLNDALHMTNCPGPKLVSDIIVLLAKLDLSDIKIFLDLKLADTKGTNRNIISQYDHLQKFIDIITVRTCCSLAGIQAVRDVFPKAHIAMVSVLTDMSQNECNCRYGMDPAELIENDLIGLNSYNENGNDLPFNSFICSPAEVFILRTHFPLFTCIVPGIRDKWMAAGQQDSGRLNGVKEVLKQGAAFVVMGSQLTKGNPKKRITAEESCQRTMELIEEFFTEK